MSKRDVLILLAGFVLGVVLASAVVVHLYGKLLRLELMNVYSSAQTQQENQLVLIKNGDISQATLISERWLDHCRSAVSNLSKTGMNGVDPEKNK